MQSQPLLEAAAPLQRAVPQGHVLRAVGHDLTNMITAIRGYCGIARRHPDMAQECLDSIHTVSQVMESLAGDISVYGLLESDALTVHASRFSLLDAMQDALQTVPRDADRHPVIMPDKAPRVFADRARTTQVLANLLGNAVKYSPQGGAITLSAERCGDRVRCSVRDSGLGIPQEQAERLFEPFMRLERDSHGGIPGTGLGLAIARQLVELQGGKIWAEGGSGGAALHFTLPLGG